MADIEKVETIKKCLNLCATGDGKRCLICVYKKHNVKDVPPVCSMKLSADSLQVIEQLEKTVEDQAERIAIMSEGGWHDAEKDSPKETDCYIVRIDYGVGQMTTMREYVSSEGKWLKSIEEKITHWMQLPEPPEEGDGK